MKANEVVRFRCGDCQIVFDLSIDHVREIDLPSEPPTTEFGEPVCCPFCGAGELAPLHGQAIRVAAGPQRCG